MNDLEKRRKRIETVMKVLGLGIVGFFVAPFIFLSIKGIIGLFIAVVLSVLIITVFVPWFAKAVANWRLKALKAEAAKNPIETLDNEYLRRKQQILDYRNKVRTFAAEVKNFGDQVAAFKKETFDDPKEAAAESASFDEKLVKMKQLLALRTEKYVRAQEGLETFEKIHREVSPQMAGRSGGAQT